jgi:hypothetical protein
MILKLPDGVHIFEPDGTRSGDLARSGSADLSISAVIPTADRTVVLETREGLRGRGRRELVLYQIDKTGRRIGSEVNPAAPPPKVDGAQAIDNWVFVDSGSRILVFSAPALEPVVDDSATEN